MSSVLGSRGSDTASTSTEERHHLDQQDSKKLANPSPTQGSTSAMGDVFVGGGKVGEVGGWRRGRGVY